MEFFLDHFKLFFNIPLLAFVLFSVVRAVVVAVRSHDRAALRGSLVSLVVVVVIVFLCVDKGWLFRSSTISAAIPRIVSDIGRFNDWYDYVIVILVLALAVYSLVGAPVQVWRAFRRGQILGAVGGAYIILLTYAGIICASVIAFRSF